MLYEKIPYDQNASNTIGMLSIILLQTLEILDLGICEYHAFGVNYLIEALHVNQVFVDDFIRI